MLSSFAIQLAPDHGGGWRPGIGDPTVMGWVTVVVYFAAAWACAREFQRSRPGQPLTWSHAAAGWLVLTVALTLLGVNKQLDLQSWLTETARTMAIEQGWYRDRRAVQIVFIAAVGVVGLVSMAVAAWLARGPWRPVRISLLGFVIIVSFVVIRAASFHRVDLLIHHEVLGAKVNWLLELGGLAVVLWGTRRQPSPPGRIEA
ncbi:MAG: hypothetical protein B7733_16585 [Myxococcales bacterium FL481]|nr:MAG: hypothetical protein B7733_16585 [Myxococcales bacterium FL481]